MDDKNLLSPIVSRKSINRLTYEDDDENSTSLSPKRKTSSPNVERMLREMYLDTQIPSPSIEMEPFTAFFDSLPGACGGAPADSAAATDVYCGISSLTTSAADHIRKERIESSSSVGTDILIDCMAATDTEDDSDAETDRKKGAGAAATQYGNYLTVEMDDAVNSFFKDYRSNSYGAMEKKMLSPIVERKISNGPSNRPKIQESDFDRTPNDPITKAGKRLLRQRSGSFSLEETLPILTRSDRKISGSKSNPNIKKMMKTLLLNDLNADKSFKAVDPPEDFKSNKSAEELVDDKSSRKSSASSIKNILTYILTAGKQKEGLNKKKSFRSRGRRCFSDSTSTESLHGSNKEDNTVIVTKGESDDCFLPDSPVTDRRVFEKTCAMRRNSSPEILCRVPNRRLFKSLSRDKSCSHQSSPSSKLSRQSSASSPGEKKKSTPNLDRHSKLKDERKLERKKSTPKLFKRLLVELELLKSKRSERDNKRKVFERANSSPELRKEGDVRCKDLYQSRKQFNTGASTQPVQRKKLEKKKSVPQLRFRSMSEHRSTPRLDRKRSPATPGRESRKSGTRFEFKSNHQRLSRRDGTADKADFDQMIEGWIEFGKFYESDPPNVDEPKARVRFQEMPTFAFVVHDFDTERKNGRRNWKRVFNVVSVISGLNKMSKKSSFSKKKQNSKEADEELEQIHSGPVDPVYSLLKCAQDLPRSGGKSPCSMHPHCSGQHPPTYGRYPSGGDSSGNTSKTSSPSSSDLHGNQNIPTTPLTPDSMGSDFKSFYKLSSPAKKTSHSPKTRRKKLNARMKSFSLDTPDPPKQLLCIDEMTKKKSSSFTNTCFGGNLPLATNSCFQGKESPEEKVAFSASTLRKKFAFTKASSLEIDEKKRTSYTPSPKDYTPSPKESPKAQRKEKEKPQNLNVALYNFKAKEKDDMDLRAGWRVSVTDSSKKDWWKGKSHGKSGYFPATYVIPITGDQRVFQVLQPLNLSDGSYAIKFHKDQIVLQVGEEIEGMITIRAANNRQAMCPLIYLQEL